MSNKYKILLNYIKDLSIEIPDPESLIIARGNLPNYIMDINITPKALKNKMIEVNTIFKFEDHLLLSSNRSFSDYLEDRLIDAVNF